MDLGGGRKRGRPDAALNGNGGMKRSKQGDRFCLWWIDGLSLVLLCE
ncbi:hypothetical protein Patl1_29876 [Pistacia atlantica]|uniref:Uncharacterized protein n=1 Tax=Pistacia atlantica TaxID=434234 RepID=A0ACC1AA69_9ROSI|nr:hypothetical protein Patl1_29876 [Pistacia atlantica]